MEQVIANIVAFFSLDQAVHIMKTRMFMGSYIRIIIAVVACTALMGG